MNDLEWRDLADRRKHLCLTLFYKIMNHGVNYSSEGILLLAKGGTKKNQAHNIFKI